MPVPSGSQSRLALSASLSAREGNRSTMFHIKRNPIRSKNDEIAADRKPEYEHTGSYQGSWRADKREGYGIQVYSNGTKYEGGWRNDLRHGEGSLFASRQQGEGAAQTGGSSASAAAQRRKAATSPSYYLVYKGQWQNGVKHGQGTLYYGNGDVYEGCFVAGQRGGQGVLRYAGSGDTYEGEWEHGQRQGVGCLSLANGDSYTGGWAGDVKHGPGRFVYAARRCVYVGEWVAGRAVCGEMQLLTDATQDLTATATAAAAEEGASSATLPPELASTLASSEMLAAVPVPALTRHLRLHAQATTRAAGVQPQREDLAALPPLALAEPSAVLQQAVREVRVSAAVRLHAPGHGHGHGEGQGQGQKEGGRGPGTPAPASPLLTLGDTLVLEPAERGGTGGAGGSRMRVRPNVLPDLYQLGLSTEELEALKAGFAAADTQGRGYISTDASSLSTVLLTLGLPSTTAADLAALSISLTEAQGALDDELGAAAGVAPSALALAAVSGSRVGVSSAVAHARAQAAAAHAEGEAEAGAGVGGGLAQAPARSRGRRGGGKGSRAWGEEEEEEQGEKEHPPAQEEHAPPPPAQHNTAGGGGGPLHDAQVSYAAFIRVMARLKE